MQQVLLGALTVAQLVNNFPVVYGTGKFITVVTKASHCIS
jgi:hypothetical protein